MLAESRTVNPWASALPGRTRHNQRAGSRLKALERFRRQVREMTGRRRGRRIEQIVEGLSVYLTGWRGYFGSCETP